MLDHLLYEKNMEINNYELYHTYPALQYITFYKSERSVF